MGAVSLYLSPSASYSTYPTEPPNPTKRFPFQIVAETFHTSAWALLDALGTSIINSSTSLQPFINESDLEPLFEILRAELVGIKERLSVVAAVIDDSSVRRARVVLCCVCLGRRCETSALSFHCSPKHAPTHHFSPLSSHFL